MPEIPASNLHCGSDGIWTTPNHRDAQFRYGDDTDWLRIEEESFWYRHRSRCLAAVLRRFPPEGGLFEIGSGNGTVALALQAIGVDVVAIEPTLKDAIASHQRGVRQVICANIEEAGFPSHSIPNVGLFDVLEHIPDDLGFLRTIRRLSKDGGWFYCAAPAWSQLWSSEDTAAGHHRRYRLGELGARCEAAGFHVQFATYFFAPLVLPIFLLRTLPSLLRLRVGPVASRTQREHRLPSGLAGRVVSRSLEAEARRLEQGGRRRIGASCLVVAQAV